jgi:hypothetical protein
LVCQAEVRQQIERLFGLLKEKRNQSTAGEGLIVNIMRRQAIRFAALVAVPQSKHFTYCWSNTKLSDRLVYEWLEKEKAKAGLYVSSR